MDVLPNIMIELFNIFFSNSTLDRGRLPNFAKGTNVVKISYAWCVE